MTFRQHTEAAARAFAQSCGLRPSTARTALGVRPQAAAGAPILPDRLRAAAGSYAAQYGLTVSQATKALLTATNSAQANAKEAAEFAQIHNVSFLDAFKALGFDPGTPELTARVQRLAIERRISHKEAVLAVARQ